MKKKILKNSMIFYQFNYYDMRNTDERLKLPASFTQFRAHGAFFAFESIMLLAACDIIHRIIYGHTFVDSNLPDPYAPSSIIGGFAYVLVVCWINCMILGSDSQIQHYKKIFDAWDKPKRGRWGFYTYVCMVLIILAFLITLEMDQTGLHPKTWIENIAESLWNTLIK